MRWKIGFFTARHPEIDKIKIGSSDVILAEFNINAPNYAEAVKIAKSRVDVEYLKQEVTRRWPNAKFVSYTGQHLHKKATVSWLRSFTSWRIIE